MQNYICKLFVSRGMETFQSSNYFEHKDDVLHGRNSCNKNWSKMNNSYRETNNTSSQVPNVVMESSIQDQTGETCENSHNNAGMKF